jgi:hypothetical protein
MEEQKFHLENIDKRLRQWDAEIDKLKATPGRAKAEAVMELLNQMAPIRIFLQPKNNGRNRKRRRAS